MKKIFSFLILLLVLIPLNVNAASGTVKVTSSSSTGVVGNTITYTVTLASSTKIGSWTLKLNYDSSYLSLQSTTSEGGSTTMANSSATGLTSKTYTYTFKILKSGSSTVSVSSSEAYAYEDMSKMTISTAGKTVTFKTQAQIEAAYSDDATLKSLSIEGYELEESFSSGTYVYNVVVPENTKTVTIKGEENNYYASIIGIGEKEVSSGNNTFEVVVTAQNGDELSYKINVNVVDENPIEIAFSGGNYTVVKVSEYLTKPEYFSESTIIIDEVEVPCFINDNLGYTLVGLKNSLGEINLYIYTEEEYVLYSELEFATLTLILKESDDVIEGYIKTKEEINGVITTVYKVNEESGFSVFCAKNVSTGDEGLYIYDEENNSVISYSDEYRVILENEINNQKEIILYFAGALSFTFLLLIIALLKKSKKKKNKHEKTNEIENNVNNKKVSKKNKRKMEEDF